MARRLTKYPRYNPRPLRELGMGAFSDFAADVVRRNADKLKSCSLVGHWRAMHREGIPMDWERIAANWAHYKQSAKRRWARLTEAELDAVGGQRAELAAQICVAYGISANAAQMQLESWQGVQVEP